MDFTDGNLTTLSSLRIHNMTVEEMVEADTAVESHFHFSKGIWWRQVKPFFFQPVNYMKPIRPHEATPKPWLALGGYYHIVPEGAPNNGSFVVNEIPFHASYDLHILKRNARHDMQKAFGLLRICRVSNLDDLLGDGYKIYLSWEQRIGDVLNKRSDPTTFRRWMVKSFQHPHSLILGAYLDHRLVSFVIAHAVEGVADLSKSFSDREIQKAYHISPSSALFYAYVKICAQNRDVHKVCFGLRSHNHSLEVFKSKLGIQQVSYPAFICLRPLIRPLVRWWMPMQYKRLMGEYERIPESTTVTKSQESI